MSDTFVIRPFVVLLVRPGEKSFEGLSEELSIESPTESPVESLV